MKKGKINQGENDIYNWKTVSYLRYLLMASRDICFNKSLENLGCWMTCCGYGLDFWMSFDPVCFLSKFSLRRMEIHNLIFPLFCLKSSFCCIFLCRAEVNEFKLTLCILCLMDNKERNDEHRNRAKKMLWTNFSILLVCVVNLNDISRENVENNSAPKKYVFIFFVNGLHAVIFITVIKERKDDSSSMGKNHRRKNFNILWSIKYRMEKSIKI